jgi:hypothetical protein
MRQTSDSVTEYLRMLKSERTQAKLLGWKFRDSSRYRDVCSCQHDDQVWSRSYGCRIADHAHIDSYKRDANLDNFDERN